jgi:DNA-directed RNA polymerase specialized sigma24 family protein
VVAGLEVLPQKKTNLPEILAARLTERQRDCISLRLEYGLTIPKIAARLGLHHSTVQHHIRRAAVKIQQTRQREQTTRPYNPDRP